MARIYNRDNINYSGLIGQAIQNANQTSQLYANKYQPWNTMGQGVGQVGEKLQQAGWNEWSAQQNDARDRAKLEAQQQFQAQQNEANRELQRQLNAENNANALRIAELNKATQNEYKMDEYHKGLSLAKQQLNYALHARDISTEGSPEWFAADREAAKASTDIAYFNSKINGADAKTELNKALESGDPLKIAWARARVGETYQDEDPYKQAPVTTETKKEDLTPPVAPVTETVNEKDPNYGVSQKKQGDTQISHLPKQFKTDADVEKAKVDAGTIKDPNVRRDVLNAIDKIADKGTIEGNNAKLIAKYDGVTISNRDWDKLPEEERKSILKLMKRSGTGKLTKR